MRGVLHEAGYVHSALIMQKVDEERSMKAVIFSILEVCVISRSFIYLYLKFCSALTI